MGWQAATAGAVQRPAVLQTDWAQGRAASQASPIVPGLVQMPSRPASRLTTTHHRPSAHWITGEAVVRQSWPSATRGTQAPLLQNEASSQAPPSPQPAGGGGTWQVVVCVSHVRPPPQVYVLPRSPVRTQGSPICCGTVPQTPAVPVVPVRAQTSSPWQPTDGWAPKSQGSPAAAWTTDAFGAQVLVTEWQ
jgi:hypothetical protein